MKILFRNVTAVTMDPARPVLQNACVAVEGTRIASVGQEHPVGEFRPGDRRTGQGSAARPGQLPHPCTHGPAPGLWRGSRPSALAERLYLPRRGQAGRPVRGCRDRPGPGGDSHLGYHPSRRVYAHTGAVARTVLESGVSANLSCGGVYFGAPEDFSPDACGDCRNQIALTEEWNGAGTARSRRWTPPHPREHTSNPSCGWMVGHAAEHGLGMHVHVSDPVRQSPASKIGGKTR